MTIYHPPSVQGFVPRHMVFSTWTDHLPFGYDLVATTRPGALIELGVFHGQSYFGFCQSVVEQGLATRCYGVDTWLGDRHTSAYDERIHREVEEHNRTHYAGFSTLMRMTFEAAASRFDAESLDLIHLDGLHTYEAVRDDFRTWFPKLRAGGIFLFHDIRARLADFGVWRFWEELEREHETFAFDHGFGLGVLRKGGGHREDDPDLLRLLFDSDPEERNRLRRFYAQASRQAELERKEIRRQKLAEQWSREKNEAAERAGK
jgi:hypothetical protein